MRAPVVTICGSMRFYELMLSVAAEETRAGRIVLLPHAIVQPDDQGSELKAMLDRLHRDKIDLSDRIIVVSDLTGYYGTSTAGEITYALRRDLPVTYRQVAPSDAAPDAMPCGFGCGYLADSETDLNEHESCCADQFGDDEPCDGAALPAPRAARSVRRPNHGGGAW